MAKRAIVAMSGGVDSSVAAYLTKEAGYDVIGVTMRLFDGEIESTCCSLSDVEDAKSVARRLSVPHYVFNFKDRFRRDVIDRFIGAYEAGETPNPCIDCNRYLKFDELVRRADELGCERIVTGHYARIVTGADGSPALLKGTDPSKDQSYVLYSLSRSLLSRVSFPLGGMTKAEVRRVAESLGFVNAEKRDSQDICFVPDGKYADFIERYTGKTYPDGDFVDAAGTVLGRHRGTIRYTVGQRRGLGLALPESLYVTRVDTEKNEVVLGRDADLFSRALTARDVVLRRDIPAGEEFRVSAKVRYRQPERQASATVLPDGALRVVFDEPVRAVTPGQSVVLYDGDEVLGGGIIIGGNER